MQQLLDKLKVCRDEITETDKHSLGYRYALKMVMQDIEVQMLDIESRCAIELVDFMYSRCAETIPTTSPQTPLWLIDIDKEVTSEELYELFQQSKTP